MDDKKNLTALDEELAKEPEKETTEPNAIQMKRPWLDWEVGGNSYKLKLTTQIIIKLETAFNDSLLNVVLDKGIPELRDVIAILQGAMQKFQHGMKSANVEELYDQYLEAGKTQIDMLIEVIYPLMYDAGFFTRAQLDLMTREMENLDSNL